MILNEKGFIINTDPIEENKKMNVFIHIHVDTFALNYTFRQILLQHKQNTDKTLTCPQQYLATD